MQFLTNYKMKKCYQLICNQQLLGLSSSHQCSAHHASPFASLLWSSSSSSLGILFSRMVPTYFSSPACASGPGVSLLLLSRLCAPFVFVFVLLFCFRSFLVFALGHPNPCRRRKLFPSFLGRYCAADGVFGPALVFAAVVLT